MSVFLVNFAAGFLTATPTVATLARLMPPELPPFIDLLRLAAVNETLKGGLQADSMNRLKDAVKHTDGMAQAVLRFFQDEAAAVHVRGTVRLCVEVLCQRCLLPMRLELASAVAVMIVGDEADIPHHQAEVEPLVHDSAHGGEHFYLAEFVEDELLLALPVAPVHTAPRCTATQVMQPHRATAASPFAVLQDLLKR